MRQRQVAVEEPESDRGYSKKMANKAKESRGSRRLNWGLVLSVSLVESVQFFLTVTLIGAFLTPLISIPFGLGLMQRYPKAKKKLMVATVLESVPFLNALPFFCGFVQPFVWLTTPAAGVGSRESSTTDGAGEAGALTLKAVAPTKCVVVPLAEFGTGDDGLAEVVKWLVKEGEAVTEGQSVVELAETSRGWSIEMPSPAGGVVATIKAEVGRILRVGQVLLVLEVPEAQAPALERELGLFKSGAPKKEKAETSPAEPADSSEEWRLQKEAEAPPLMAEGETDDESWTLRKEG